ncbi:MAG TPA: cytochrome c, partial [Nitrospiria bacterium]|nr:cytochrome c [Nitrospiria bacterium]
KRTYDRHCALCHGKKGEGMGPSLKMSNFMSKEYQASRTDQELFDRISKGAPGTGMPAWEKKLPAQAHWDLVAYLRTLGPK